MAVCQVSYGKNYAVLLMKSGENRINNEFLKEFNRSLDEIERCKEVQFLITTGEGKFFSNGLDLSFMEKCTVEEASQALTGFADTLSRIITFPVPTIAALNGTTDNCLDFCRGFASPATRNEQEWVTIISPNSSKTGHTYAAGAFLALAHDYRVMRTLRGWFCLPEIKLKLQFDKGYLALLRAKIKEPNVLTDAVLMGKRFDAKSAMSGGIVQYICSIERLLPAAVQMGQRVVGADGFDRETLKLLKSDLYSDVVEALAMPGKSRLLSQFQEASKL